MRAERLIALVLACVACKSTPTLPFAVELNVTADGSFTAADVRKLDVTVSGSESGRFTSAVAGLPAKTYYKPRATGKLSFAVTGRGLDGSALAAGSLQDVSGKTATVVLHAVSVDDFAMPADMTTLDDLAMPIDLAMPDLAMPTLTPSHVGPSTFKPNAGDLSGVIAIDTGALTIQMVGVDAGAAPAGVTFAVDSGRAVLSVGKWTVDRDVVVSGSLPLVVVAAGAIVLQGVIHAAANLDTPGPGGSASGMGAGLGQAGINDPCCQNSGGGGAGFGTMGAAGGDAKQAAPGGMGGAAYGTLISDFFGGSGGGAGGIRLGDCTAAAGGAGGGAVQLSSALSITVDFVGGINVGGGGGRAGCSINGGGGGGGSGGEIFLEAPSVIVNGTLASNGGGGGGGDVTTGTNGGHGGNATLTNQPAAGGNVTVGGGNGGAGAAGSTAPVKPVMDDRAGGGGGAVGRIWLRTRGTPATVTGVISPSPMPDTSL